MNNFFTEDCKNTNRGHIVFRLKTATAIYVRRKKIILCFFDDGYKTVINTAEGVEFFATEFVKFYPELSKTFDKVLTHLHRRVIPSKRKIST